MLMRPGMVGRIGCLGAVIGQELIINGSFDADTWWSKGGSESAGVTIAGGVASFNQTTGNGQLFRAGFLTSGRKYRVQYVITSIASGSIRAFIGAGGATRTVSGSYSENITATGTTFTMNAAAGTVASIDNVSVRLVK
jgi:hypothetical protein